tara:strand:+ start:180 stop:626 length:447 start_codon:yes stop_codon:yes gene_type:complete
MKNSSLSPSRRGLALIEVIIAVGILTVAVAAITSAILAGQQQSIASRTKIIAAVAAESLIAQISTDGWDQLDFWHGYEEPIGTITDPTGMIVDGDFELIGRKVNVANTEVFIEPLEVYVVGKTITVTCFGVESNSLLTLERFIPEPSS